MYPETVQQFTLKKNQGDRITIYSFRCKSCGGDIDISYRYSLGPSDFVVIENTLQFHLMMCKTYQEKIK